MTHIWVLDDYGELCTVPRQERARLIIKWRKFDREGADVMTPIEEFRLPFLVGSEAN